MASNYEIQFSFSWRFLCFILEEVDHRACYFPLSAISKSLVEKKNPKQFENWRFFFNKNDLRHAGTKISIAVIVWSSFECSTTLHSSVLLPKKSTEDDFPNLFHQFLPQVNIYNHFFLDCSHEPVLNCWVQYLGLKIVKQKKQTNIGRQRRELAPLQRGWTVVNVPVGRCHGCRHLLIFSSDYYYILSHYRWKLGPLRFLPSFFFRFPYRVLCGLFFFRGPVTAGRSSAE